MKISFTFLFLLILCAFALGLLLRKYLILRRKNNIVQKDFQKLTHTLQKVRYGQLALKSKDLSNKPLQKSVNRLIETLFDREAMILEYQKSLSEKNNSLEKMIELEKESQKFKEDFIATLTHDLKTPIIAELNSLEILLSERLGPLNEKQKHALSLMKSSNEELIEMSEILLETYKLQQTALVLKKQKSQIVDFIENIIEEMQPIAINNGMNIIFDTDFDEEINIDRFQLKRAVKNLLLNAISFSQKGSVIQVKLINSDDKISINITNQGESISKEDLEMIFKKYYSGAKKYRKLGTGLGLYLANQIAIAHKGAIDVISADGETTFTVMLPKS
ncbi:MAG: HAMP domain-containing sensor histidine kinase [Candidatus Gastranaerophilales bacterium]|nr:HAMP domain-containing sensor histidine kinase [Candidatus Gastranaerophilales bacterium]